LQAALERIPATEISADVVQESQIPYASRCADALAAMAESYLAASGSSAASMPIPLKVNADSTPS
jgi:hypothetical protein